ncbi:NAD(P)H-binding protein [Conexibacter sp. JD483]|uniref:NAD(P)H-binding protein n=1 Tax=unclassified Conexibacter TaxID=2627773 RepID=UPI00271DD27D|nr:MULTISPECIES: NAD(P)H-binding protein [unclassified Conexibacter]MDO8189469.1 NAD(P)H-binding protein [Conexibacter sp. CPCC 205706]MDO8202059.1 NAD(P)H-binding protein [Conexibacter sp. CPCC 205762]MDR9372638.1 NAD(P)H-binding protein [Conexibacter sp. JD483]
MSTETQDITLVTGAAGKTGRRVAEQLERRGIAVRRAGRSTSPAFEWERPETWAPLLEGAGSVYIAYAPDLALPGAAETVGAFARQAVAAGARRLVVLSGRGEPQAEAAERAVAAAGADWTVVRCSWFMQNFSESFFAEPLQEGTLALPVDGVREPFVDCDDVADVAVAALTESGHAGRVHELTGTRLLSFDDAVAAIAAASGRRLDYVPVTAEQYADGMRGAGVPEEAIALTAHLFAEVLDGRNESLTDGVRQALGRPPRDFADYAAAAAATGVWSAAR